MTFRGRKADVHKTLISASEVHSEGRVAVVDLSEGYIILAFKLQLVYERRV